MKWIKYFVGLVFLISFFSISYSSEHADLSDLWEKLRGKYPVFETNLGAGNQFTKEERHERINQGILKIEEDFHLTAPEVLKEFYREVGNLTFFGVYVLSPIDGVESQLYEGIGDGKKRGISEPWFVFAWITGSEYFCINSQDGRITRFFVGSEIEQSDTYSNIADWLIKTFLKN